MTAAVLNDTSGYPDGCVVVWMNTVTRASAGFCGRKPAEHLVSVACRHCLTAYTCRVCRFCWDSYAATGLCGTCLKPLKIEQLPGKDTAMRGDSNACTDS
jgi:hypothetical protein